MMLRKQILLLFILHAGIQNLSANDSDSSLAACRQKAGNLLDEAFRIIQKHYYRKDHIEWEQLREKALNRLHTVTDCENAYGIIDWCFKEISERHSFIIPPSRAAIYNNDTAVLKTPTPLKSVVGNIHHELIDNQIGYISIPWVNTTDDAICTIIADSLHQIITQYQQAGVRKWILDLRENRGGNCWPMLAGVGQLLGNGVCGYFVSNREKVSISFKNGAIYQGKKARCTLSKSFSNADSIAPYIALLTGPRTSSSGELLALAFRGKENVMLFGQPTAGFTTANATYALSDNSMLVVTVCREADRNGIVSEGRIEPDKLVKPGDDDAPKGDAVMWLQSFLVKNQ